MLHYDFEESIGYWLITTAQAYQRVVNEELAPQGITWRQCQVLGYLALEGPLSQAELADRLRIEPPTLVGILDRMERDAWIQRQECSYDRRKKLIVAAENSAPVWEKIVACARRVRARAVEGLTDDEVASLKHMLKVVQANLGAPVEQMESLPCEPIE